MGLESLEARELLAGDIVMYNDAVAGAGTHPNVTTFIANGVSSGTLKDVATGAATSVTVSISQNGVVYEDVSANPVAGTDAANIFNGFVDFSSGTSASPGIAGVAGIYSYVFRGLNPAKAYDLAGTAVRGDSTFANRWTRVSLISADSFTAAHSSGVGVVTSGLAANEVAIWTGANHEAGQGYVAQWREIRPGADGTITLMSRQYTGATPGVGTGSAAGALRGYAVTGLRLVERSAVMEVVSANPTDGTNFTVAPTTYTVDFSRDVNPATLDAADLQVDGVAATGVTLVDADTATWALPSGLTPGLHNVTIAANALNAAQGLGITAYNATFRLVAPPVVQNAPASDVMPLVTTIGANLVSHGGQDSDVTIYWGTVDGGTNPNAWQNLASLGTRAPGTHTTSVAVQPETTYFYRAFARNFAADVWSPTSASFVTPRVTLPSIANGAATSVGATTVRLNGTVTQTGGEAPQVIVYYGTSDGGNVPGNWQSSVNLGAVSGAFSRFITGLAAETEYFYRSSATNRAGTVWASPSLTFTTTPQVAATVVINEVHYAPNIDVEQVEFIELYNASNVEVDVSGWSLGSAVDFTFPAGATIGPNAYFVVTENASEFATKFGRAAQGVWELGDNLNNDGEAIRLRDAAGVLVDEVDYQLGYPWPTSGDLGQSMELVNPALDNNLGGSWRSSSGSDALPQSPITLLAPGATWKYRKGTSEPSQPVTAWRTPDFVEDNTWLSGRTPIGYADNDDATVLSDMVNSYPSVYLRNTFTISGAVPPALRLRVYVDDGAIIYLNGVEVRRLYVSGGEKAFNALTDDVSHEAVWEDVMLGNLDGILHTGTNTIAIHAINQTLNSSDFSIDAAVLIPAKGEVGGIPTPGAQNSVFAENLPPQTRQVDHSPKMPTSGEAVTITVKATDSDGVGPVNLQYQVVNPGNYIRLTDATYATSWVTVPMVDDGTQGDAVAGDDIYSAVLPGSLQTHRRLIRYRISATDAIGATVTVPYADDPQPNFAYFVYDGVPDWRGSLRPGQQPVVTYSADALERVATYHLIANTTDVTNSQYNSSFNEVQFNGTIVYDGIVYDHIEFRNRGVASTYQVGKNKWKINFTRGHSFEARDNYGNKYDVPWDKLNILPGTNPWWRNDVSTEGTVLFEPAAFKLYELAGTPSPRTQYFQFRIVDDAVEASATSQYEGDFWGLYTAIEQPDGRFLDSRGLPDGNMFNMHGGATGGTTERHQGSLLPDDRSDLVSFLSSTTGYRGNQTEQWWRTNVNLPSYFAWYAINLIVNNSDLRPDENVNYYHNQENNQWYMMPWDLDLTFEDRPHLSRPDTQWENLQRVFSLFPNIKKDFDNYARSLMDLLLDNGQAGLVVSELANVLTGGQTSGTMVQANQAQWDYHPRKAKPGIWYANFTPELMPQRTFESLVEYMKKFVTVGGYGRTLLGGKVSDVGVPDKPTLSYVGLAGFPKNAIELQSSEFSDPQGAATFNGMQWRVAEIHDPSVANYDPNDPYRFEIETTWESDILTSFVNRMTIPSDKLEAGKTYRARVRMRDTTGNWSHWSEPVEFQATVAPPNEVSQYLRISEINYNPTGTGNAEFIELTNISAGQNAVTLDLAGVAITQGPSTPFVFPEGTTLAPGAYLVVVRDQAAFQTAYPTVTANRIAGVYTGALSNSGETIELEDDGGNTIVRVDYSDADPWSQWADGLGGTLVIRNLQAVPFAETGKANRWSGSREAGGTPAAPNGDSVGIVINEVLSHTDPPLTPADSIELHNITNQDINIGGWYLSDSSTNFRKFSIPANTVVSAGGYIVFDESDFNPNPASPGPNHFALNGAHGDDVWLIIPTGASGVAAMVDEVHFQATRNGETTGRVPNGTGRLVPLSRSSLGCENGPSRIGAVVISEIQYNPSAPSVAALAVAPELTSDDLEFIEIHNTTSSTLSLTDWQIRGGADYDFAPNTALAGRGTLILVSFNPADPANATRLNGFRTHYGLAANVPIVGGYAGGLDNGGEIVRLESPDEPPLDEPTFTPHLTEDEVPYSDVAPWPTAADGQGNSLSRRVATSSGWNGLAWHATTPSPGTYIPASSVVGDFDGDGLVRSNDIDVLVDNIRAEAPIAIFDLNGDSQVNGSDLSHLVSVVIGTNFGDFNLDRSVDGADLVVWQSNAFRQCRSWATGDANGDGVTDGSDFNIWNQNKFVAAAGEAPAERETGRTPRAPQAVTVPMQLVNNGGNGVGRASLSRQSNVVRRAGLTDATFAEFDRETRWLSSHMSRRASQRSAKIAAEANTEGAQTAQALDQAWDALSTETWR